MKVLIFKHLPSNFCQWKEDQLSDCQPQQTNWLPKLPSPVFTARPGLGFCFAKYTFLLVSAHFKTFTLISLSDRLTVGKKKDYFSKTTSCPSALPPPFPSASSRSPSFCHKTTSHQGPAKAGLEPIEASWPSCVANYYYKKPHFLITL